MYLCIYIYSGTTVPGRSGMGRRGGFRYVPLKQRNKALTLARAQTIHYTSNKATHRGACQTECVRSAPLGTPLTASRILLPYVYLFNYIDR